MKAPKNTKQLHRLVCTRIERAIKIKSVSLADSGYHVLVVNVAMQIVKSLGAGGEVLFLEMAAALPTHSISLRNLPVAL
jgi:hypothetical protein